GRNRVALAARGAGRAAAHARAGEAMSTHSCPKANLVEALRDGRLGAQERASMERHLPSCAECTALSRALDRIGEAVRAPLPEAKPLEHQRARAALLEKAAEPQASMRP